MGSHKEIAGQRENGVTGKWVGVGGGEVLAW